MEVLEIPVGALVVPALNPRRLNDKEKMAELAESIREIGVLQPLVCRKNGKGYEVIAGSRRLKAAETAGLKTVPITLRDVSDAEFERIAIMENLQRSDLDPVDEGKAFRTLLKNRTIDEVAKTVCRSRSYIRSRILISELPIDVVKDFRDGKIDVSALHVMATAGGETKKAYFEDYKNHRRYMDEPFTARRLRQRAVNRLGDAPWDLDVKIGGQPPCMTCQKRTGVEPSLFTQVSDKDTCLDRTCWGTKMNAFVQSRIAELEAKGETVLRITPLMYTEKKGVLASDAYAEHRKKTEHKGIVRGIYVEPDFDGRKAGSVRWICREKNCIQRQRNYFRDESTSDYSTKARETNQKFDQMQEERARQIALEAVHLPNYFTETELRLIVRHIVDRAWWELRKKLWRWLTGIEKATEQDFERWLSGAPHSALQRAALAASLQQECRSERFWEDVSNLGIAVEDVRRQAKEEIEPKRKASLERIKKKATSKKKTA